MRRKKILIKEIQELKNELRDVKELLKKNKESLLCNEAKFRNSEIVLRNMGISLNKERKFNTAMRQVVEFLLRDTEFSDDDYEKIYNIVRVELDDRGFRKYQVAEELTNINVHTFFPYEESCWYFEEASGDELYEWLKKAVFGEIEWEQLEHGYEKANFIGYEGHEEEIVQFEKELYKKLVIKLLDLEIE